MVRFVSCRKKAHFTFDFPQITCVYINKKVRIYVICRKYVLLKNGAEGNRTTIQCFKMPINTDGFKFCVVVRVVVNL